MTITAPLPFVSQIRQLNKGPARWPFLPDVFILLDCMLTAHLNLLYSHREYGASSSTASHCVPEDVSRCRLQSNSSSRRIPFTRHSSPAKRTGAGRVMALCRRSRDILIPMRLSAMAVFRWLCNSQDPAVIHTAFLKDDRAPALLCHRKVREREAGGVYIHN